MPDELCIGTERADCNALAPQGPTDVAVIVAELDPVCAKDADEYKCFMAARLRFSIAAAKKHDVLLIDEALATGDAKFRRRSEQRVRDLRKEAGTVCLVSHSEQSIRDTCERAIWLESGLIRADGPTEDVLKEYEAYVKR